MKRGCGLFPLPAGLIDFTTKFFFLKTHKILIDSISFFNFGFENVCKFIVVFRNVLSFHVLSVFLHTSIKLLIDAKGS